MTQSPVLFLITPSLPSTLLSSLSICPALSFLISLPSSVLFSHLFTVFPSLIFLGYFVTCLHLLRHLSCLSLTYLFLIYIIPSSLLPLFLQLVCVFPPHYLSLSHLSLVSPTFSPSFIFPVVHYPTLYFPFLLSLLPSPFFSIHSTYSVPSPSFLLYPAPHLSFHLSFALPSS